MEEDLFAITYKDYMLLLLMITSTTATIHSCEDRCGDLSIPFPFGTTGECCLNEDFLITCNASGAFLPTSGTQVLNISLDGQLHIATAPAYHCYDENGYSTEYKYSNLSALPFPISYTQNMLTAIGCDTNAIIAGVQAKPYAAGCISYCEQAADLINGSCTGMGCCQTPIPTQVREFTIGIGSFFGHYYVWNFSRCSYSFLVEVNSYNFSTLDLADLPISTKFSVVLDWAVRDETCDDARLNQDTFACKANNSRCYDSHNGPGYLCKCSPGYHGNPYLPNGCQDVNECETESLNHCTYTNSCVNSEGNFTCFCPKGYHGDGRINGTGCIIDDRSGASTTLLFLFLCICIIVLVVQKRSMLKLRKEYFKQNGGFLLQRLLFKSKDSDDAAKIIAEEELKKATNNFNKNMVIGQGGFGVVYKGILSDNRIVAIKRSKAVDKTQIEQFVNEVVVLSQIHHPHIVKILGCCLETSVPLLVYEFITNSTLFHHLHDADCIHSLTWDARLRIAEETAGALAYMHSMQIIHRDVKSANILLDDELNAKVSDFGVSRLIPFDQEQISTLVQGTLGYMDPEYFQSGILTEKSDVYSFGVVLVELLTGKKAICSDCKEKSLALYFIYSLKEDRFFEILDKRVKEEGSRREIERVVEIARSCLRLEGEKRPTMKQVIEELQTLRHFGPLGKQRQLKLQHNSEEEKSFLW